MLVHACQRKRAPRRSGRGAPAVAARLGVGAAQPRQQSSAAHHPAPFLPFAIRPPRPPIPPTPSLAPALPRFHPTATPHLWRRRRTIQ